MPRCGSCGTVAVDSAHFCPRCGAGMSSAPDPAMPPLDAPPPGPPQDDATATAPTTWPAPPAPAEPAAPAGSAPAGSAPPAQDPRQWPPPPPGTEYQQQAPQPQYYGYNQYPQYPQYGGGYAGYAGYQAPAKTNGMAIASLVLSLVWMCGIGSILAVIFGYMGKNQIDRSNGTETGRGLAVAGLIIGWIGVALLVLYALFIVLSIIGVIASDGSSSQFG